MLTAIYALLALYLMAGVYILYALRKERGKNDLPENTIVSRGRVRTRTTGPVFW